MFTRAQQDDGSFFPQQTVSTVHNGSGYDSFTSQMNNNQVYSQQVGNQQHGHHPKYPYARQFNTQYLGLQQPQMMPMQKNGQLSSQDTPFLNQYDYHNASFQYNARQNAPVQSHHNLHGSFQQPHQFTHLQQMHDQQQTNNNVYAYQQHPTSNQVSSYPRQGSYMPRGKTSCYISCSNIQDCVTCFFCRF